jgi:periplasmic protein TonB
MASRTLFWIEERDPRELRRWGMAAAVVVLIHGALIAGYLFGHEPDQVGDDATDVTVELAPIDTLADAKQRDVAPAPEEMVEQKATPQPQNQPDHPKPVEPPPPVDTDDAVLPQEKPPIEPSWESRLVKRLQAFKRYPGAAQSRGEEGVALLAFSVDRNGHVLTRRIVKSSGHADLDEEVLAMIERAQPLPPFPPGMTQTELSLTVPIRFSLR